MTVKTEGTGQLLFPYFSIVSAFLSTFLLVTAVTLVTAVVRPVEEVLGNHCLVGTWRAGASQSRATRLGVFLQPPPRNVLWNPEKLNPLNIFTVAEDEKAPFALSVSSTGISGLGSSFHWHQCSGLYFSLRHNACCRAAKTLPGKMNTVALVASY